MNLQDLINRTFEPEPLNESESIPWSRADFSAGMLKEHLTQNHDMASRRQVIIENQVEWIHKTLLKQKPSKILELGCGPGFYTNHLAGYGHTCKGIDFAPAALEYAKNQAVQSGVDCDYLLEDLRTADYGTGFDLVLFLFGDFNAKAKSDAAKILPKISKCLKPGGKLLLELIPLEKLKEVGTNRPTWVAKSEGSFSSEPHLFLNDFIWDEENSVSILRYYIVKPESAEIETYSNHVQAYTEEELETLLGEHGLTVKETFDMVGTVRDKTGLNLYGILAEKTR
ncbi:MAG: class I SAM-dependent methyltransferase [bacterium]|nr:class I SAM-dependent methyltransferase [bacterium]